MKSTRRHVRARRSRHGKQEVESKKRKVASEEVERKVEYKELERKTEYQEAVHQPKQRRLKRIVIEEEEEEKAEEKQSEEKKEHKYDASNILPYLTQNSHSIDALFCDYLTLKELRNVRQCSRFLYRQITIAMHKRLESVASRLNIFRYILTGAVEHRDPTHYLQHHDNSVKKLACFANNRLGVLIIDRFKKELALMVRVLLNELPVPSYIIFHRSDTTAIEDIVDPMIWPTASYNTISKESVTDIIKKALTASKEVRYVFYPAWFRLPRVSPNQEGTSFDLYPNLYHLLEYQAVAMRWKFIQGMSLNLFVLKRDRWPVTPLSAGSDMFYKLALSKDDWKLHERDALGDLSTRSRRNLVDLSELIDTKEKFRSCGFVYQESTNLPYAQNLDGEDFPDDLRMDEEYHAVYVSSHVFSEVNVKQHTDMWNFNPFRFAGEITHEIHYHLVEGIGLEREAFDG